MLPLLRQRLADLGVEDPMLARCAGVHRYHWSRNQLLFRSGAGALDALSAAGVPTLLLEGAALVAGEYRDAGLRPMNDVDVAVPESAASRAVSALRRAGWSSRHEVTDAFMRVKHAAPFVDASGSRCNLHWRILGESSARGMDGELWAASREIEFHGRATRIPSPADRLLHVCVVGARPAARGGILWMADAMWLIDRGDVDWARLVAQARRRRLVLRLRDALELLKLTLDAAVPDTTLADLAASPETSFERVERRILSRRHPVLGQLPLHWCQHLRASGGVGWRAAVTFPRYLQYAWGLASLRELPRGALTRAVRRLRTRAAL